MGIIYIDNKIAQKYITAWKDYVNNVDGSFSLANTVEIIIQEKTIGLIVLPNHFLRVAWHYAYDELVYYAKYKAGNSKDITRKLNSLEGSYMPLFLPGTGDFHYIYGDLLNFYCPAMVRDNDSEPQASISAMARALNSGDKEFEPTSISSFNSDAISNEIKKYSKNNPEYKQLKINAIYSGDGFTVVNALGGAIKQSSESDETVSILNDSNIERFRLSLFPSPEVKNSMILGRYITELIENRRLGKIGDQDNNSWIWKTDIINNSLVPKLKWSKQKSPLLASPAHITIAFDIFSAKTENTDLPEIIQRNNEIYGLSPSIIRKFHFDGVRPKWTITIPENVSGKKHPNDPLLTELLADSHLSVLRSILKDKEHPSLVTILSKDKEDLIDRIHDYSDWVIIVDKIAGLELFDTPNIYKGFFDKYIIDIIPETRSIENSRIITSTGLIEEIEKLLKEVMSDAGLDCNKEDLKLVVRNVKAISGRLALSLNEAGAIANDIIAISYLYENCRKVGWHCLSTGFFIPGYDIKSLLYQDNSNISDTLSPMLFYLSIDENDRLKLDIVSIRFIRFLKAMNEHGLKKEIVENIITLREIFDKQFLYPDNDVCFAINMKALYRMFIFYLEKANRHNLNSHSYKRLREKIEAILIADSNNIELDIGDYYSYLFCPQFNEDMAEAIHDNTIFRFFGNLERLHTIRKDTPVSIPEKCEDEQPEVSTDDKQKERNCIKEDASEQNTKPPRINLGKHNTTAKDIYWEVSKKSNPHLMVVGISGMGKTTCLRNICMQAMDNNIIPIIFSYHEDIDTRLAKSFNNIHYVSMDDGLGFNPLFVSSSDRNSYLDNCGMIRDIFANIYSDLGDLQQESIRESVLQTYIDLGFSENINEYKTPLVPDFQKFYDILVKNTDASKLNPRFKELNNYGFFKKAKREVRLLDINIPIIIQFHKNQNEKVQRGLAFFMLFRVYQNMFLRGEQNKITHMIIFDEAHKAKRLTLIRKFARECRKYGISLVLSSQSVDDFEKDIFSSIANFLVLKSNEPDARTIARAILESRRQKAFVDKVLKLKEYYAVFRDVRNDENTIKLKNV